jgi:replication initiation and membrane attachment protein DnaB
MYKSVARELSQEKESRGDDKKKVMIKKKKTPDWADNRIEKGRTL